MFIMKHFKHRILPSILSANFNEKFTSYNGRKMAKIISGKEISDQMKTELKKEIQDWVESTNQRKPQLTCVLVGNNPSSATYVQNKMKAAELVGIDSKTINLDENISEKDLMEKLNLLNNDDTVDGILVQLPLPASINERTICNAVSPEKDVDGFHITNIGKLCLDMKTFIPCTAIGVIEIIKRSGIETFGKNIVVVGRSKNVGLPIAMLLHSDGGHDCGLGMDATVTICHRYTPPEQLQLHCKNADIIISAVGKPGLIKASMVKPGAVLIDVGLTRVQDPDSQTFKLVGDVDFEEVSKIAGAITPVPGGVGPMTVAMLMQNTFLAAKNKCKN